MIDLGLPLFSEGDFTLRPTVWAPRPDLYQSWNTDGVELEAAEFLAALVRCVKPERVLETGTHRGCSAAFIADALRRNGVGSMVTLEIEPALAAQARELLAAHGLADTCRVLEVSSLEYVPEQPIDFYFSDSALGSRIQEIQRLRQWLAPRAWVAVHDSLSHRSVIGDLGELGWIERADIPTPRGLTVGRLA